MENKKKCPVGGKGIGGQAVIEGVMMRGKKLYALAVRTPKKEIVVEKTPIQPAAESSKFNGWPIIRGVVAFVDSLVMGMKLQQSLLLLQVLTILNMTKRVNLKSGLKVSLEIN